MGHPYHWGVAPTSTGALGPEKGLGGRGSVQLPTCSIHSGEELTSVCTQLCLTLCNSMDYSPPGSSVYGILQARILEWVDMPSSRGSSQPRTEPTSPVASALAGRFFTTEP